MSSFVAPAIALIGLALVGALTLSLLSGQIPFVRSTTPDDGTGNGGDHPVATPAPSNVIIVEPKAVFPGSIVYAKAGNIWIQTDKDGAHQLTNTGDDSMPTFSADGQWIYFIRTQLGRGKFAPGGQSRSWYDLPTPGLLRMKADGSGVKRLLTGSVTQGTSKWFYWLRQPVPSPDGKTVAVISDGPNPLQSDIVLKSFSISSGALTSLNVPESLHLGHQDPAWRQDGKYLLYVQNGRELTHGAPRIFRYDPATKKTRVLTGPGYITPAFSPDGAWIAATKTDAFGTDIAILDANGKEVLRVTDDAHSFSPVWSPAGDAMAYLHLEGTIVDLRMVTLDRATGRWAVTATIDLTKVSGLDGASRPTWFVPPSQLPAPSGSPAAGGSVAPSAP